MIKTTKKNISQLPDKRCSVVDIWTIGIYASLSNRQAWGLMRVVASIKPRLANPIHRVLRISKIKNIYSFEGD